MADATYGAKRAPSPDILFRTDDQGAAGHVPYHKDADRAALVAAIAASTAALGTQTTLASILSTLQAQADIAVSLWTDNSGAFYVRRDVIDQDSGTVAVTFTNPTGTAATPGAGLRPVANEESLHTETVRYISTVSGTGHTAGDMLERVVVMDANASPPTVVSATWVNLTTGAVMATAPTLANLTANPTGLPSNASTETTLAAASAKLPASLGTKADSASLSVALGTQSLAALTQLHTDLIAPVSDLPMTLVDPLARTRTIVNVSGADTDVVLAADAAKAHVVTGGILSFSAAGNITLTNDTTDFVIPVVAGEKWVLDDNPAGWWVTAVNEAFSIGKSAAITVTGVLYSKKV